MAGTIEFSSQEIQIGISRASNFHKNASREYKAASEALEECPSEFQAQLADLTVATEKLASSTTTCLNLLTNVETSYGDMIENLLKDKERNDFVTRHRDFVSQFEERVFQRMRSLPKYKEALEAGAKPLKNRQEALELLWQIANAEKDFDEDIQAGTVTKGNLLMRDAWNESVMAKGLELEEYIELRIFKNNTNRCLHQSGSAAQALAELKKLPLPDTYARFKPTLMKLLEVLSGPQKALLPHRPPLPLSRPEWQRGRGIWRSIAHDLCRQRRGWQRQTALHDLNQQTTKAANYSPSSGYDDNNNTGTTQHAMLPYGPQRSAPTAANFLQPS